MHSLVWTGFLHPRALLMRMWPQGVLLLRLPLGRQARPPLGGLGTFNSGGARLQETVVSLCRSYPCRLQVGGAEALDIP